MSGFKNTPEELSNLAIADRNRVRHDIICGPIAREAIAAHGGAAKPQALIGIGPLVFLGSGYDTFKCGYLHAQDLLAKQLYGRDDLQIQWNYFPDIQCGAWTWRIRELPTDKPVICPNCCERFFVGKA